MSQKLLLLNERRVTRILPSEIWRCFHLLSHSNPNITLSRLPTKYNGFFRCPYATLPPNFVKLGLALFANPANKQTNADENITSLAEVTTVHFVDILARQQKHDDDDDDNDDDDAICLFLSIT